MLDIINKSISKLFGNKSQRDIKEIRPIVDKILAAGSQLGQLSNDALREKTTDFKKRIADYIAAEEKEIESLRASLDADPQMDVAEKEKKYGQIDQLKKNS